MSAFFGLTKRRLSYNLYRIFCTIFLGPNNHRHIVNHRREGLDSAASYLNPKLYAESPAEYINSLCARPKSFTWTWPQEGPLDYGL